MRDSANEKLPCWLFFEVSYELRPSTPYFRDSSDENAAPWRFHLRPIGARDPFRLVSNIFLSARSFINIKKSRSVEAEMLFFVTFAPQARSRNNPDTRGKRRNNHGIRIQGKDWSVARPSAKGRARGAGAAAAGISSARY